MRRKKTTRLLEKSPVVYLGPGAAHALSGDKGLLLGAQRPGWVDVLAFEPLPVKGYRKLVDLRFSRTGEWEVVGIVLPMREADRAKNSLIRELVPGDVVLALSAEGKKPVAYVNRGDELSSARLKISRFRNRYFNSTRSPSMI